MGTPIKGHVTFAVKYRPKHWDDVVGQKSVVDRLKGALLSRHIPNALLLYGPTGTGKTTLAQLFVRYLNCDTNDVCGICPSCQSPFETNTNIIQMNAADQRGIDAVRDLIKLMRYKPSFGAFRCVIIDEVHNFTANAFQALLQPLENMPPSTLIIFTTTDPQKVPKALAARCLPLSLGFPTQEELTKSLVRIIKAEKLKTFLAAPKDLKRTTLDAIIRASCGHVRNAIQWLEAIYLESLSNTEGLSGAVDTVLSQVVEVDKLAIRFLLAMYKKLPKVVVKTLTDLPPGADFTGFLQKAIWLNHYQIQMLTNNSPTWVSPECKEFGRALDKTAPKLNTAEHLSVYVGVQIKLLEMRKEVAFGNFQPVPYLIATSLSHICT